METVTLWALVIVLATYDGAITVSSIASKEACEELAGAIINSEDLSIPRRNPPFDCFPMEVPKTQIPQK